MKMVKVKTADLVGAQLDFAVAQADGLRIEWRRTNIAPGLHPMVVDGSGIFRGPFPYSTCWRFGGPIIERERITIAHEPSRGGWSAGLVVASPTCDYFNWLGYAEVPLIAAMRAFVASKLGGEVEVPEVSA